MFSATPNGIRDCSTCNLPDKSGQAMTRHKI